LKRRYALVAIGGTFDRLHRGHIAVISKALEVGDEVIIGLTTSRMVKRLGKKHPVASYKKRECSLLEYLKETEVQDRTRIVPLKDHYGPTVERSDVEAIVVSRDTAPRAEEINQIREKKGMSPLAVVKVDMVLAEDEKPIYSTRVHRGEIDRAGRILKR
jgi:cytidyltransferase-like protein